MKRIIFALLMLLSFNVYGGECLDMIALSKVVSAMVESESSITMAARNFCKEYNKKSRSNSSSNLGISYKFLSTSMGSGATSEAVFVNKDVASIDYAALRIC